MKFQTIYAEASPRGHGGISVIRLSGPDTCRVLAKLCGRDTWEPREQRLVHLKDVSGRVVDQVMVVFHPGPRSYTGEDLAEISCHGNPLIVGSVLECIRNTGYAVPAGRGEFTRRAYLHGKIDLSQAEAVGALIDARSLSGIEMAQGLLDGALSREAGGLIDDLRTVLSDIEASFILPDYETDEGGLKQSLQDIMGRIQARLQKTALAPTMYGGIHTIIAGLPNAGKSSLFNAIVGAQRAIVHEEEGTTRDIIREHVHLGGLDFIFHDTAGIRQVSDGPEKLGIDRTLAAMRDSNLLLYVVDSQKGLSTQELDLLQRAPRVIVVMNKADLKPDQGPVPVPGYTSVGVSAKYGTGLDELFTAMQALFPDDLPPMFLERHIHLYREALTFLDNALSTLDAGMMLDAVSLDVGSALKAMRSLTGEELEEDILDTIFEDFCVGK